MTLCHTVHSSRHLGLFQIEFYYFENTTIVSLSLFDVCQTVQFAFCSAQNTNCYRPQKGSRSLLQNILILSVQVLLSLLERWPTGMCCSSTWLTACWGHIAPSAAWGAAFAPWWSENSSAPLNRWVGRRCYAPFLSALKSFPVNKPYWQNIVFSTASNIHFNGKSVPKVTTAPTYDTSQLKRRHLCISSCRFQYYSRLKIS